MNISIIIPTYNESEDLKNCLESLGNQKYPNFEIIVVDDGSTDDTLEILSNLKNTLPKFNYYVQNHKGAGAARNNGVAHAKGDILVFVDADMTFDATFLEKLTAPIRKNLAKGTFSKEEYVANWDNVWSRCWNINESWEDRRRHPKNFPNKQPVFRAILKSEFNKVGGFTPGGYNDDWSLSVKLGYLAEEAEGAIFYHKNPASLSEIFVHAKWVGKREYKYGLLGYMVGLIRSSFPISILVGVYKSIKFATPSFIVFKIVYDLGIFLGIASYVTTKAGVK